jgi:hypothetical protein
VLAPRPDLVRTNLNGAFDYAAELLSTRSPSEDIELSTVQLRKQLAVGAAGRLMKDFVFHLKFGAARDEDRSYAPRPKGHRKCAPAGTHPNATGGIEGTSDAGSEDCNPNRRTNPRRRQQDLQTSGVAPLPDGRCRYSTSVCGGIRRRISLTQSFGRSPAVKRGTVVLI